MLISVFSFTYTIGTVNHYFFYEQLGEPPMTSIPGLPSCNPLADPPVFGDCWYNCTSEDISGEDKKHRLHKVCWDLAFLSF